jgi:acyl-CoA synthetase (NDP forming)/RimJ/RimL family protein N-acetyltransferase
MHRSPLRPLAAPSSIALFGARPAKDSLGGLLTHNVLGGGFRGRIHLINPSHREIDGHPCHPSLETISGPIDLALIITPAATVIDIIEQCGRRHIKAAVVYSTGFDQTAETGQTTTPHEQALLAAARQHGVRLLGPRALGFIRPHINLNATPFLRDFSAGNLAFVSQSSAVCASVLDWVFTDNFALSAVFGLGNGCDISLPEIVDLLAADPSTESILLYLEGIPDSRHFMSSLRAAARAKPVVVVKAGRVPVSTRLASTHSRSPAGDDQAFDAALRRAGALRVRSIGDLFSAARALTSRRKPQGKRLAIVTNGGGPAIMAADSAAERGICLAELSAATVHALQAQLPASWSIANPVDIRIDAGPRRFDVALGACLDDPGIDGALVILSPNSLFDPTVIAEALIERARSSDKPVLVCCMGEASVREARRKLTDAGLPVFRSPESAVTAFSFMVEFVRNQRLLLETPASLSPYQPPDVPAATGIISAALQAHRITLSEAETRQILSAFHIPLATPDDLGRSTHGRQLSVSIRTDDCFGPVIELGQGGMSQEPGVPCTVALPPLNDRLIGDLLQQDRVAHWPTGAQDALRRLLLRVSELACELPWIARLEINPVLVDEPSAQAGMARITLHSDRQRDARYGHMAICPYPLALKTTWQAGNGPPFTIRPIRPEDATAFQTFVRGLSDRSRYYRFFGALRELPPQQLVRRTQIDYDREMVLVAVRGVAGGQESIVAEAFYGVLPDGLSCEFGVVVADNLSGLGVGARIMNCLMDAARQRGLKKMRGEVLSENKPMRGLVEALGFHAAKTDDPDVLEVSRSL